MIISVLIANWNTRDLLRKCLESLQEIIRGIEVEVIVVDNASTDGSSKMVKDEFPNIILIQNTINKGFGAATNQAAQLAKGVYWLLLNPDTIVHPDSLSVMVDYLDRHPSVGAVGPLILNADKTLQVSVHPTPTLFREAWRLFFLDRLYPISQYSEQFLKSQAPREVDVLKGACILLRRDLVEQIGLFDEQFFMYSEEVDLCRRVKNAGWEIHWLPDASITHYGGESTKQVPDEMFMQLYLNKIRYFQKHAGALVTGLYKGLLYLVAASRWITMMIAKTLPTQKRLEQENKARQYGKLFTTLHRFKV